MPPARLRCSRRTARLPVLLVLLIGGVVPWLVAPVGAQGRVSEAEAEPVVPPPLEARFGVRTTRLGPVLVDAAGHTLYLSAEDPPGQSECTGPCTRRWTPVEAGPPAEAHGDFTILERADGTPQWAWRSKPLYRWIGDTAAGDVTGDGIRGTWYAAVP